MVEMLPIWNHRLAGHAARHPGGLTQNSSEKGEPPPRSKCALTPLTPSVMGGCVNKVNGHRGQHIMIAGRRNGFLSRHAEGSPVRPRLVTVIRPNEDGAIRKISLLLNRRAVVSFEQLLSDISEALGYPSWNNDRVRHLLTPAGQMISSLSQFFQADDAFLALGRTRPSLASLQVALEELYPGCQGYCDKLMKRWQLSMRPKASKADSGFHDVSPKAGNSLSIQTIKPSPNNLQPIRERPEQRGRDVNEDHKKDRERKVRRRKEKMEESYLKAHSHAVHPLRAIPGRQGEPKAQCLKRTSTKCTYAPAGSVPDAAATRDRRFVPFLPNAAEPAQAARPQEVALQEAPRQNDWGIPELPDGGEVTQMDIERCYDIGHVVGDGNFAVVRVCVERRTGHTWAMKVVDKAKLQGRDHMIHNEVSLLASLRHPRVVHLLRCHHTHTHVYLIMELASDGDLFDAIVTSVKFSEACAAGMLKDISDALQFIHSRSIVHRDIKPENLLVHRHDSGAVSLKLADFGLALVVTEPLYTVCGTPTYVAPEILAETGYGVAVDVWAMGVILYILLCGFPPFRSTERNQVELFKLIRAGELHFLSPYWDKTSDDVKDLIRGLLQVNPKHRLTAQQALQHTWVGCHSRTSDQHTQQRPQLPTTDNKPPQITRDLRLPQINTAHRDDIRPAKTKETTVHQTGTDKTAEDEHKSERWMRETITEQTNELSPLCRPGDNIESTTETSGHLTSHGTNKFSPLHRPAENMDSTTETSGHLTSHGTNKFSPLHRPAENMDSTTETSGHLISHGTNKFSPLHRPAENLDSTTETSGHMTSHGTNKFSPLHRPAENMDSTTETSGHMISHGTNSFSPLHRPGENMDSTTETSGYLTSQGKNKFKSLHGQGENIDTTTETSGHLTSQGTDKFNSLHGPGENIDTTTETSGHLTSQGTDKFNSLHGPGENIESTTETSGELTSQDTNKLSSLSRPGENTESTTETSGHMTSQGT